MQTVTIDIINTKAVKLLQDLEELDLIHIHKENVQFLVKTDSVLKYKGTMTKQPLEVIQSQLDELRNGWE